MEGPAEICLVQQTVHVHLAGPAIPAIEVIIQLLSFNVRSVKIHHKSQRVHFRFQCMHYFHYWCLDEYHVHSFVVSVCIVIQLRIQSKRNKPCERSMNFLRLMACSTQNSEIQFSVHKDCMSTIINIIMVPYLYK